MDLHIKALVGYKGSQHYHVFELTRQLPRFAMYNVAKDEAGDLPLGFVKFTLQERVARVGGLCWGVERGGCGVGERRGELVVAYYCKFSTSFIDIRVENKDIQRITNPNSQQM